MRMVCHCGKEYKAKRADLKRGWGYSCSKRCAAIRRTYGRPKAKQVDGGHTKQVRPSPTTDRRLELIIGHPLESGYWGHGQE